MIFKKQIFLFFFSFFFLLSFSLNSNNIATVNISYILENNIQYQEYLDNLTNKKETVSKIISQKENFIIEKKNEIENLETILQAEELNKKILAYNKIYEEFLEIVNNFNQIINNNLITNEEIIMEKIVNIIKKISISKKIDIVLSENNFIISSENLDISKLVNNELDNIKIEFINFNEKEFINENF